MTREASTSTIKRRLAQSGKCTLCGNKITEFDDFKYLKVKFSRNTVYSFFHTECLLRAVIEYEDENK